jgi:hypothetical protein
MWVWVGASGFGVSPPSRESGPRYLCRPVSEEPVEIIRRMNAAFNAGDYDAMALPDYSSSPTALRASRRSRKIRMRLILSSRKS